MKRKPWVWIVLALGVLLFGCGGCAMLGVVASILGRPVGPAGGAVAVIEIKGVIVSGDGPAGFGQQAAAYAQRIIGDLDRAVADPRVRAIVLDIDSPGGGVVASVDIYEAVRDCSKPVVASMGETAASGAYYIACGADHVVARPATLAGSIGVRWEFTNAQDLLGKLGVKIESIKSGPFKDQGSPYRGLTEQERAMLQAMVDEAYEDFLQVVVQGRALPEAQVREVADGRVFSGRQALELGMVDSLGNLDDAIAEAAQRGGIVGEPERLFYERTPSLSEILLSALSARQRPPELVLLEDLWGRGRVPRLQYLYAGD